jgi:hypothetical protein
VSSVSEFDWLVCGSCQSLTVNRMESISSSVRKLSIVRIYGDLDNILTRLPLLSLRRTLTLFNILFNSPVIDSNKMRYKYKCTTIIIID